jgi:hypothetical protein
MNRRAPCRVARSTATRADREGRAQTPNFDPEQNLTSTLILPEPFVVDQIGGYATWYRIRAAAVRLLSEAN